MGKRQTQTKGDTMAEPWMHRFGTEVRARRLEMEMTQQELADQTGYLNASMISQIEQGVVTPHFEKALRLARTLNLNMNRILGIQGPPEPGQDWFSDMLMLRLPVSVQRMWPGIVQQHAVVNALESLVATLRAGIGMGAPDGTRAEERPMHGAAGRPMPPRSEDQP